MKHETRMPFTNFYEFFRELVIYFPDEILCLCVCLNIYVSQTWLINKIYFRLNKVQSLLVIWNEINFIIYIKKLGLILTL